MNRILLIYEYMPERVQIYDFEELTDEEFANLTACHHQYGNTVGAPGIVEEWLPKWLEYKEKFEIFDSNIELQAPMDIIGPIRIIHSGFIL